MRPSERLTSAALLGLSALAAAGWPPGAGARLATLAALLAATWLLARTGASAGPLGFLRDWLPVAAVLIAYWALQPIIEAVNPRRWDAFFAAVDERWAAPLVAAWRATNGRSRLFTDAVYLVYVSYYLLVLAPCVIARVRRPALFERAVFTTLLGFYLSFAGYLLWPTSGPRVAREAEAALGGGAVAEGVRAFLRTTEVTTLDAFPSGHTALSLVAVALASRIAPWSSVAVGPWAAAVIFSTVYIHVHYAVDVAAGVALAALTLAVAGTASRWLGGGRE